MNTLSLPGIMVTRWTDEDVPTVCSNRSRCAEGLARGGLTIDGEGCTTGFVARNTAGSHLLLTANPDTPGTAQTWLAGHRCTLQALHLAGGEVAVTAAAEQVLAAAATPDASCTSG